MNTAHRAISHALGCLLEAIVIVFLCAALMAAGIVYAEDAACYLYDGDVAISVVDENADPYWSSVVPVSIGSTWLGGTTGHPMAMLFEGFRDGNLEITAWADHAQTIGLATGELIRDELACVTYPSASDQIFADGFEGGDLSAWVIVQDFSTAGD